MQLFLEVWGLEEKVGLGVGGLSYPFETKGFIYILPVHPSVPPVDKKPQRSKKMTDKQKDSCLTSRHSALA